MGTTQGPIEPGRAVESGAPMPRASTPFLPALAALLIPLAAFALSWLIAGRIPFAVPTREWGTWFFMGPLLGVGGIAGMVLTFKAFARGSRTAAVAGFILNAVLMLTAWAGLFG
jgi:ACR3 family arsenite efflux pump ArsB